MSGPAPRRLTFPRWSRCPAAAARSSWRWCSASSTSRSTRSRRPARRSTPSTSTRCPTATPAPTCTSPWPPPATRSATPFGTGSGDGDLVTGLAGLRRGALLGARGNSGVILSQMLGAVATTIAGATAEERNASIMARALREATEGAYAAVGTPVEGTILTVIRAAAEAAEARAEQPGARARDVFTDAAAAAREALARTPDQLAVLRDAGVVDAGGRGLSVILDAAETVLTGRRPTPVTAPIGAHRIPIPTSGVEHPDLTPEGPAYEVMYLLDADDDARTEPQAGPRRPRRLAGRGRRRRALERPRPHRRGRRRGRGRDRRRTPAPDPGDALRRAGRGAREVDVRRPGRAARSSPSRRVPAWRSCSRRPAPPSWSADRATGPRPG